MVLQSQRRERTRSQLLGSARQLFGASGYEATKMDDVAEGASVAKGALYHHFKSKHELFETVLQEISSEIAISVKTSLMTDQALLHAMRTGVQEFFTRCAEPEVTQILLKDGPAVLGWQRWREIDAQNFGGIVRGFIIQGIETGLIRTQPIDPITHLIIGAISEAAINCANQGAFENASKDYIAGLELLMQGLLQK